MSDEALSYPIGRFKKPATFDRTTRIALIDALGRLPAEMRAAVGGLTDAQLDTPYRSGGWTVRQVVHHVADSHMNAYIRMKLAATEDAPAIRTYEEALWAELPEAKTAPIGMSLDLLDALHRRWVAFLLALPEPAFARPFVHPDWGAVPIDLGLAQYVWHGKHHTAHITTASARL